MWRATVTAPAVAAVAVLASAGSAGAESGPPSVWAAAAQYVEMIPTSTGLRPAGAAGGTKPLPRALATQLARRGGADAQALTTLVTSSGWGANTIRPAKPAKHRPKP